MSTETVTFRTDGGSTAPAAAEIIRYGPGARRLRAAMFIAGGIVTGTGCSIVPGPHMFVTIWALPALGIWLGVRALRTEAKIVEVSGRCPACGKDVGLAGGAVEHPRACPACKAPIEIVLER
jgi:hypothetical protein